MFTGTITHTAKIASVLKRGGNFAVSVAKPARWKVRAGESISVNGICSTAVWSGRDVSPLSRGVPPSSEARGVLHFTYMPETLRKTTAGSWRVGDKVNLERSIKAGEPFGGHLVMGHVDGLGSIAVSLRDGGAQLLKIEVPPEILALVAKKGSVSVDGVSLTVADVGEYWFSIALTPYTLAHTNLQLRTVGDRVNIETDILAKYAARRASARSVSSDVLKNIRITIRKNQR